MVWQYFGSRNAPEPHPGSCGLAKDKCHQLAPCSSDHLVPAGERSTQSSQHEAVFWVRHPALCPLSTCFTTLKQRERKTKVITPRREARFTSLCHGAEVQAAPLFLSPWVLAAL